MYPALNLGPRRRLTPPHTHTPPPRRPPQRPSAGGFGEVWLGLDTNTQEQYALKFVEITDKSPKAILEREVRVNTVRAAAHTPHPPPRAPDRTSPVHCGPSCSRASHRCSTHRALSPLSPQPCTTLHTPLEAPRIAARLPHTPHLMIDSPLHSTHIYPCTTLHASSHGSHLSTYPHLHTSTPMILIPSTSAHIPHIYPTSTLLPRRSTLWRSSTTLTWWG